MQLSAARPRKKQVISLTPLIDVVFILLLFFMLSSSFTQWNALDLKQPAVAVQSVEQEPVIVRLYEDGSVVLDGQALSAELHGALSERLKDFSGRPLIVQPQPLVSAQQIVGLFDRLRQAGADSVALANAQP